MTKIIAVFCMLVLTGCVTTPKAETNVKKSYHGHATWYQDGKKTASGEKFNPDKYTVAHKHLPFNTVIKFTNLKNNKSVNARVNDRFPQTKGRDYDLSIQCAKKLGFIKQGVIHLRAQIVK